MSILTESHTLEVPPSPRLRYLVCVDVQRDSHAALRMACTQAHRYEGIVDILHVLEPAESESLFGASDKMRLEREQEAKAALLSLGTVAESITGQKPGLLLKEGPVGETILKVAEDHEIKMLVLGVTQGSSRGKLLAWLSAQLGVRLWAPMLLVPSKFSDAQLRDISYSASHL